MLQRVSARPLPPHSKKKKLPIDYFKINKSLNSYMILIQNKSIIIIITIHISQHNVARDTHTIHGYMHIDIQRQCQRDITAVDP